jgi:hypothetical protein
LRLLSVLFLPSMPLLRWFCTSALHDQFFNSDHQQHYKQGRLTLTRWFIFLLCCLFALRLLMIRLIVVASPQDLLKLVVFFLFDHSINTAVPSLYLYYMWKIMGQSAQQ